MFKYRRRKYKKDNKIENQQATEETKKENEDIEKKNENDKINEEDNNNLKNNENVKVGNKQKEKENDKNNKKDKEENKQKDKNNEKDQEKEKKKEKNSDKVKEEDKKKVKNNEKVKEEDKEKENKDEGKEKYKNDKKDNDKNQFTSKSLSNKKSIKRCKYRFYSKNKNEEEIKQNENTKNIIKKTSKKELILEKLKEIVPIIEDKEGEENITPYKSNKNNGIEIDDTSLINNIFKNEFKNVSEDSTNVQLTSKTINSLEKNPKKFYDNELIDAILDVEKYNVNNYLSKELADIYNEINKDNVFFKNNVFLVNIDNFERKTGFLDKMKNNKFYNNEEDINDKLKEIHKTNEIINKFTEKSKSIK